MTDQPTTAPAARTTRCRATRRQVLQGAALAPAAAVAVSACSGEEGPAAVTSEDGTLTVPSADTPAGGTTYYADAKVVVTQPTEGTFRAFDATCPHQGCMTSSAEDGVLVCPCHGSRFAADTGDVVRGPAETGLTALTVTVEGGDLQIRG